MHRIRRTIDSPSTPGDDRRRQRRFGPLVVLVLTAVVLLVSSTVLAGGRMTRENFFGTIQEFDGSQIVSLRELLMSIDAQCTRIEKKCPAAIELYGVLAGRLESASFPTHLIYIDGDGQVRTNLMLHRDRVTPFLYGEENVWVLVFSEVEVELEAWLTTLWMQRKSQKSQLSETFVAPGERTLKAREAQEAVKSIELEILNDEETDNRIWFGGARFMIEPLGAYSVSVRVQEPGHKDAAEFRAVTANFSNSLDRSVDLGLGLGATFDLEPGDFSGLDGVVVGEANLNLYLMLDIYIIKPTLLKPIVRSPWARYRPSIGIAIGTNLQFWKAQEFNIGVSIGHIVGRHGLVIGVNIIDRQNAEGLPIEGDDSYSVRPYIAGMFKF
jgi:hypothetical protein